MTRIRIRAFGDRRFRLAALTGPAQILLTMQTTTPPRYPPPTHWLPIAEDSAEADQLRAEVRMVQSMLRDLSPKAQWRMANDVNTRCASAGIRARVRHLMPPREFAVR